MKLNKTSLWLLSGCFLIFCMVVIGGITRLTGSGLSITEWKPIMGAIPPMNDAEWQSAFEKYKQIPQFALINSHFQLSDFKQIFWWEWIHRQVGRLIAIVFIIPFLYFLIKKQLDTALLKKVLFLFFLGGLQGFLGWYMVSSGLTELTSVSHIRLAIHLITAFITFGFTLFYALEVMYPELKKSPATKSSRIMNYLLAVIVLQIIYGALVAGMHAGKMYTTFPLMNGQVIPTGTFYMQPFWHNFFNNPVAVQLIHRFFAFTIVFMTGLLLYISRRDMNTKYQSAGFKFLLISLCFQFILGVFTLLSAVNIVLASVHQIGAFFLFSSAVFLLFQLRRIPKGNM